MHSSGEGGWARRWFVVLVAAVMAAGAFAASWSAAGGFTADGFAADGPHLPTVLVDALAGAVFLAVGAVSLTRSPGFAALAVAAALAWFAGGVSEAVLWIHRPLMLHCALAYPTGRLRGAVPRIVVAAAWVAALVPGLARSPVVSLLLAGGVALAGWRMSLTARLGARGAARTGTRAAAALAASLAGPTVGRLFWPQLASGHAMINLYAGLIAAAGLVMLVGLLARPAGRETDVVIELTKQDSPVRTLAALRSELANRELTARSDPAARDALIAAVDLLAANVALQAELADKVQQVRASRRRLVEAAVVERHRLQQRLTGGAVGYLDELANTLGALCDTDDQQVRDLAGRCLAEVECTRVDLDQLAHGLHPRGLVEHGLAVALAELAARSPVLTTTRIPKRRFPMIIEATVWYTCAEAMANLAKHAQARSASVEVSVADGELIACVRDDGVGGAHASPAGGLAGLADRLGAVGGALTVISPPGDGTLVRATVPLR